MARLADENEEEISLFPMFNILACTLGVMVFILATVATVSLGADKAVEIVANVDPGEDDPRTPIWLEWDGLNLTLLPSGEQATFFLRDPSGNVLEFKSFQDPGRLFARWAQPVE